ncbi:MAG TPA: Spy/CpxP family protein refolding chaperone [Pseudolabrys sp.]|jgi:hypothetical protein|nr:Spy/CpxP family protein refolding chaperone [Pseudolabrys sp.]
MKLAVAAAAVAAFVTLAPVVTSAQAGAYSTGKAPGVVQVDIARIKNALRLTPTQQAYWPAVEATLRDVAHRQAQARSRGLARRVSQKVVSIILDSTAIQRLATAAGPLIVALNDDQRRNARALAWEMGLGPVVSALY